jgi:23S rRNA pseudouridine955/2504/2580 synthase
MRSLSIRENDAGQRLDKFLSKALRAMPQALLYKYIRLKRVR